MQCLFLFFFNDDPPPWPRSELSSLSTSHGEMSDCVKWNKVLEGDFLPAIVDQESGCGWRQESHTLQFFSRAASLCLRISSCLRLYLLFFAIIKTHKQPFSHLVCKTNLSVLSGWFTSICLFLLTHWLQLPPPLCSLNSPWPPSPDSFLNNTVPSPPPLQRTLITKCRQMSQTRYSHLLYSVGPRSM